MKYQNGFAPIVLIILVCIGIVAATGGYIVYRDNQYEKAWKENISRLQNQPVFQSRTDTDIGTSNDIPAADVKEDNTVTNTPPPSVTPPATKQIPQPSYEMTVMKENTSTHFFQKLEDVDRYTLEVNNILDNFYSNHADNYDFIIVLSPKPLNSDWSLMINSSGETIGQIPSNQGSISKRLKSFIALNISGVDSVAKSGVSVADFEQGNMRTFLTSLAHEIAHHWLAYIPWEGMKSDHYSNLVDLFNGNLSFADPMQYDRWVTTSTGNVCVDHNSNLVRSKFSNLSLYLMGFIPKSAVQPISVIQASVDYPYGHPQCGEATNFIDTKTYTLDDILALAGKNPTPAYPNTQKDFKIAYIIPVPADELLSSATTQFASDIINQFPQAWSDFTGNLSNLK